MFRSWWTEEQANELVKLNRPADAKLKQLITLHVRTVLEELPRLDGAH